MSGNYNSVNLIGFVPKRKQSVRCFIVQSSKFPNFFGQFFKEFFVVRHLSFSNVVDYFLYGFFVKAIEKRCSFL